MKKIGEINSVIFQKYDDSPLPESEEIILANKFDKWLNEDITKEINDKEITVIVIRNIDGNDNIHLATTDIELIIRLQKVSW